MSEAGSAPGNAPGSAEHEPPRGSLPARLWTWFWERFGPKMWLLYLVLYAASLVYGRSLVVPDNVPLGLGDMAGAAAALALFLLVRVVDEHKDYEQDLIAKPESALARGVVTLGELKLVGALALCLVLGVLVWLERGVWLEGGLGVATLSGAGVILWVFGLALFTTRWLEERFLLLTVVHLASFSLAIVWLIQVGARPGVLPPQAAWLVAHSLLAATAFEVTRKTYGPEEEPEGAPSFSKLWGPRGAAAVSGVVLLGGAAVLLGVLGSLLGTLSVTWWTAVALNYVAPLIALGRFTAGPSRRRYTLNQLGVALALLGSHSLVVAGVAVARGLTWT